LENLLSDDLQSKKSFNLFTDGACEFDDDYKPVNAGIGGLLKIDNKIIFSFSENIGKKTNNEAEYLALMKGVEICVESNILNISIFSDSELVVKQINGDYKVKNDRMSKLHKRTHELLSELKSWKLVHVLRDKNVEADELSKEGLSK
jgi:Ribonuclease HI